MRKISKYLGGDTIQGDKYRREGAQALEYQEAEGARRHLEWLSRQEMRPEVIKKTTLKEKVLGKQDKVKHTPQVIGMSGADPIGEFIVSGIGFGGAMQGAAWLGKQAINQGKKAIVARTIDKAVSKGVKKTAGVSKAVNKSVATDNAAWAQELLSNPDKLKSYIDDLKDMLTSYRLDKLKGINIPDELLVKLEDNIRYFENLYKSIVPGGAAVTDLRKVLHDFYPQLANNKYTTINPGPYTERNVAGELIYPIGTIKPGAYADYRMEKMLDLLRERGIQPSETGFWLTVKGAPKTTGTIGSQVRELTHKPATLYTTRHSTNVQGFEVPATGKSYVRVRSNSSMDEVHSTNTHEVIGHGTEIFLDDVTKGKAMAEYKAVTDLVKAHGKFKTADSVKPGELRSTLLEVHNALVNEIKRFVHGSVKLTEAIVKDRVGKMSLQDFTTRLEKTNSYGKDYSTFIKDNPQTINLFKKLLTDGLSVAAPVGLTSYGFADWQKKGGKTHKPFGHRSVLDNGWLSTKQLKNKKNVYGK